jgi:uncharacterized membrane protein YagU involved in acid resistance
MVASLNLATSIFFSIYTRLFVTFMVMCKYIHPEMMKVIMCILYVRAKQINLALTLHDLKGKTVTVILHNVSIPILLTVKGLQQIMLQCWKPTMMMHSVSVWVKCSQSAGYYGILDFQVVRVLHKEVTGCK